MGFFQFTIITNLSKTLINLALFDSLEYLCYGSTAVINILNIPVDRLYTSEPDVYRRLVLTYKDRPPR